jgi:hypothetical protein
MRPTPAFSRGDPLPPRDVTGTRPESRGAAGAGPRGRTALAFVLGAVPALVAASALLLPAAHAARAASPPAAAQPDFSGYQRLLDDYLTVISPKGAPVETRFDYARLFVAPNRPARLDSIRAQLLAIAPSGMDARTRLAWAINTYNFLVLENATRNLLVPNRGLTRYRSVREMINAYGPFFERPVVEVEGTSYSLSRFERHLIFHDYDRMTGVPPPAELDPRAHLALALGCIGSVPLLPRVYRPETLEAQLDHATKNALAHPSHLRFVEDGGALEANAIFDWHYPDFGGQQKAFAFVMKYAPRAIREKALRGKLTIVTRPTRWDWDLNQTPRKPVVR